MEGSGWESAIHEVAVIDDLTVAVGFGDSSLPLIENVQPTSWVMSDGQLTLATISELRSLGLGYLIGGIRLPDGLEHVTTQGDRFIAYTGYLQVWDGFHDGLTLEPREAWSSLVLVSKGGLDWEPHILAGFGLDTVAPFGDGFLAAAVLPPPSPTEIVRLEGGTAMEVAATPTARLYYSTDALTWSPV